MTSQIDGGYTKDNAATPYENMVPYLGTVSGATPTLTQSLTGATAPYYINSTDAGFQDNTYITEALAEFFQKIAYDRDVAERMQSNGYDEFEAIIYLQTHRTPLSKSDVISEIDSFFSQYAGTNPNPLPTSTGELAQQFVDFALTKLNSPVSADYYMVNTQFDGLPITGGPLVLPSIGQSFNYLTGTLEQLFKANLGVLDSNGANLLNTWTLGLSASAVGNPPFPDLSVGPSIGNTEGAPGSLGINNMTGGATTLIQGMVDDSFSAFVKWLAPSQATISLENFVKSANQFYGRLASVSTYFQVYSSFFLGASSAANSQAQQDLYGFIQNIVNDPTQDGFEASRDFGAWFTKVQENYISSLNGVPSLNQNVLDASAAKTQIVQRIYALIVEMIGIIQKTTAAQADQLKVLTTLQGEMTNMISKAPILTSSQDNQLSSNTEASASTVRDELNQVVTAWTDTIRANRDFQKSLAQSVQTNINSSNDAVNQQASMATALIQQQSTILSAIYR